MTYVGLKAVLAHQYDEHPASFLRKIMYVEGVTLPVRNEQHVARVGFFKNITERPADFRASGRRRQRVDRLCERSGRSRNAPARRIACMVEFPKAEAIRLPKVSGQGAQAIPNRLVLGNALPRVAFAPRLHGT